MLEGTALILGLGLGIILKLGLELVEGALAGFSAHPLALSPSPAQVLLNGGESENVSFDVDTPLQTFFPL